MSRSFVDDVANAYVLGPVRAAIGALLGWHALNAATELAQHGYFADEFHVPWLTEAIVPSHDVYAFVLAMRVSLAVMVMLGIFARPALATSALLGFWILLCDRNQFHHNRYCLDLFAFLLALTPCDRSWRAGDSPLPRVGPFWAVHLARLQVTIVYLASGGAKLVDSDWQGGLVLADRIARYGHVAVERGVPARLVAILARADVASGLAKAAITTELCLAIGLWLRPTRVVALFCGFWFHVFIQATSNVETFSLLMLAMYGLFVTPDEHARKIRFDPSRLRGKAVGLLVPLLDWFGRFEVAAWEPDRHPGHSIVIVRRDGERSTGIRAVAMLTRCLPILFPFWAPLALVASFTKRGDLTTRG